MLPEFEEEERTPLLTKIKEIIAFIQPEKFLTRQESANKYYQIQTPADISTGIGGNRHTAWCLTVEVNLDYD